MKTIRQHLGWKLFISYLVIIIVAPSGSHGFLVNFVGQAAP